MAKGDWWLKLEIHTWLNDPKVRKLKRENRDSWLTACMLMTLDGSAELSGTTEELGNALHLTLTDFYDFMHDLANTGTADVTRCHAESRNGLEIVTIKSRRYARDLNTKEKNRLRKEKQRGHADVTPVSQDIVISKKKEVRKEEEKREEEAPAIEGISDDLAILETEKAFSIHLDLATQKLVAGAVPPQLISKWAAFIKGRAVGYQRAGDVEKLRKIGYALTDFQKDNKAELNHGTNNNGYRSERDKQDERVRNQRAEEERLFAVGLAKREAEARRALSGDSSPDDTPDDRPGEPAALIG